MLTAERLRELLDYDPGTGVFTWRVSPRGGKVKAGDRAGCVVHTKKRDYWVIRPTGSPLTHAHRLAFLWMTGEWPPHTVDHIDGNGLNNAWANLRHATLGENALNKRRGEENRSGFIGVHWATRGRMWCSQITRDGRTLSLGYFETAEEAARVRDGVAREFHGEFARLNFPDAAPLPWSRSLLRRNNSSGFSGVYLCRSTGRYSARVGKRHIGYFPTPEAAARARGVTLAGDRSA